MQGKRINAIFIIFEVLALLSSALCVIMVTLETKNLMCIMPLSFFVFSFIFRTNYKNINDNISVLMIQTLFMVRLVILPLVYAFSPMSQLFESKASVELNFNKACIMLGYEFICVQLAIFIYQHSSFKSRKNETAVQEKRFVSFDPVKYLVLFILVITVLFPAARYDFKSITDLSDPDFTVASERIQYNVGTIGRIIKTLYSIVFQIVRILFPASVIYSLKEKKSNSRIVSVILVFSCAIQFFFLTSTFAEAIVSCLALILFYISLYPDKRKTTYSFLGFSTIGMILLYFTVRYYVNPHNSMYRNGDGALSYIAKIINAYFTGVDNVAAIYKIPQGNEYEALSSGLIGAIPFNSTLFGSRGNKLQYFFNAANQSYGQIPPTIGAGYYYFGTIFAPIITIVFVLLSLYFHEKANCKKGSLKFVAYIFCSIVFALGTVMYSPSITLSWFCGWAIPILLLTSPDFIDKIESRKE